VFDALKWAVGKKQKISGLLSNEMKVKCRKEMPSNRTDTSGDFPLANRFMMASLITPQVEKKATKTLEACN